MTYHLDTSACVDYLRRPDSHVRTWMTATSRELIFISSITKAELLLGVQKKPSERNRRTLETFLAIVGSIPFDDAAAGEYAKIRADLEQKGRIISGNDMLIAAVALTHGATLVTGNMKEFERISSLTCISLESLIPPGKTSL